MRGAVTLEGSKWMWIRPFEDLRHACWRYDGSVYFCVPYLPQVCIHVDSRSPASGHGVINK